MLYIEFTKFVSNFDKSKEIKDLQLLNKYIIEVILSMISTFENTENL